jgi:hypothetical protein
MKPSDLAVFSELLRGLGVLYGKPVNPALVEIYWRVLERFELAAVKMALEAHVGNPDSGQFMPKPADVVRYVEGNRCTQALHAWSQVRQAIQSIGVYRSVVFDDALTHAVITDMGGWIALCHTPLAELPFKANEFEKRYAAYVLRPPAVYPRQLVGILARDNQATGQPVEPPLLLGVAARAEAVYQGGGETALAYSPAPTGLLAERLSAALSLSTDSIPPKKEENV